MKVAIVHDWLVGGGAERVVEQLHRLYPDAPIYTSYCSDEWRQKLDGKVVTGYLQHWPFSKLRRLAVIMSWPRIWWFNRLDLSQYDLVITSAGNGEAKDITTGEKTVHICYCHTPPHYYWRSYKSYLREPGFGILNIPARIGLKFFVGPLRKRDYKAGQKPDHFIANSSFIAEQIKKDYGRNSVVINPPVDIERFQSSAKPKRTGFITVSRQVQSKRVDLIIDACTKLNLPLVVVGNGPRHADLVKRAGPSVIFPGFVSDEDMLGFMSSAEGFIMAAQEDFGITPVEAMAAGTPVIAYHEGGAADYVIEGKTGTFFEEQTIDSLCEALQNFKPDSFDNAAIAKHALHFSGEAFRKNIQSFIDKHSSKN